MREGTSAPMATDAAEYLTARQFAALIQVSQKSVFRWATEDPSMPALRIGRTLRFPRARLLAWLRSREQGPGRPRRSRTPLLSGPQVLIESDNGPGPAAACAERCATGASEAGQTAAPDSARRRP